MAKENPKQKSALAHLHQSVRRPTATDALAQVKRAVLGCLKADVSDADIGREVRLAVMDTASLPRAKSA